MSTVKWVNAGEDAGALYALLLRLPATLPVETMDGLWIFPTRRAGNAESTVVVVATFTEEAARRRVYTAHFRVTRNNRGVATVEERVDEHAVAPLDALPRVVDGVVRRVGEEVGDAPPRELLVAGNRAQWDALIREFGGEPEEEGGPEIETETTGTTETEPEAESRPAAEDGGERPGA